LTALPRYRDEGRPFEAFVFGIAARKWPMCSGRHAGGRAHRVLPRSSTRPPARRKAALAAAEAQRARDLLAKLPDHLRELMVLRVAVGLSAEETGGP